MKIICAGLGRTGTTSLAAALRILGFTVHDFLEHLEYNIDEYLEGFEGKMPDFVAMYKDVDATTDNPSFFFWKELHESFPKAKVILTERDSVDVWVESRIEHKGVTSKLMKSGLNFFYLRMLMTTTGRKLIKLMAIDLEKHDHNQPDKLPSIYLEHNSRVKASIPRDQLLVFNVKQGWKPLCEFVGVDVPDVPFPRLNKREKDGKEIVLVDMFHQSDFGRRLWNEFAALGAVVIMVFGIFVYMIVNLA